MTEPLKNGHDTGEETTILLCDAVELAGGTMSTGSVVLQEHIHVLQTATARHQERVTIEALIQGAMKRYADGLAASDFKKVVEAAREIMRLEIYLSRRGFTWCADCNKRENTHKPPHSEPK